jgi:hypothetical protein
MKALLRKFQLISLILLSGVLVQAQNSSEKENLRLSQKVVSIDNSVYDVLDHYETSGVLPFLPAARPYSKQMVVEYLNTLLQSPELSKTEKKYISNYVHDFERAVNGFIIRQEPSEKLFTVLGAAASIQGRNATGNNGSYSTSSIMEPFFAGDLGSNISYFAGMGGSIDRLAADPFYESYVKNGEVHFPHEHIGYSYHPYMFDYESMWAHVPLDASSGEGGPLQHVFTAGMIYHAELSGSWFDNALRLSFHNQRRSWGIGGNNLNLSARARRFPGVELIIQPNNWLRYSMLTGSLFHYANQSPWYKQNIYGYDLGNVQKMLSLHMVEFMPLNWLQISLTGGNIWSKRFEPAYILPFLFPHLMQIDVGDHDNLSMSLNVSVKLPQMGKVWFSTFIDEMRFVERENLLNLPRNRYAWQAGWNSTLLSSLIPLTKTTLSYTRVTPYVYTHYPEADFNTFGSVRPVDMTYTHDGSNLGFYLPPNSAEIKLCITNLAIENLKLMLDNRYIIHGTNDLSSDSLQIYGDVYRYQTGDINAYPLLDFTQDGIYDYTFFTELSAEYRINKGDGLRYYRLISKLGFSHTQWEANKSAVSEPAPVNLLSFQLGISVDL